MGTFYICAMDPCGPLCWRLRRTREMHNRKSQNYRFRPRRFKRIRSTSAPFGKNASRSLSSDRPVASCRTKNFFYSRGCCCWEFQFCPDQDMLGEQRTGSTLLYSKKRQHLMAAGGQVIKTSDSRLNTTVQQTANSKQHQRPCTSSKSAGWVPASS